MFSFKNSNSGKIRVKLLATLLVLTLTFANFALVGSYIGEAIAAEIDLAGQDNNTNSDNVKFDVYLDKVDENNVVRQKIADINSQELMLHVSVSVQGEGNLNNAVIELKNTNFKFKNKPELTMASLGSIQSQDGITIDIPIVARKDEAYNLDLLNMQSQIRLTGEYVDANGVITEIDTTKAVKINWIANELTEQDIYLSQEVITNKIYNIDGMNKRIIQILVKSQIQDNKAPVENSTIEIENPVIGLEPQDVKVASCGTQATNGKTSIEFADGINSFWEYDSTNGKTYINVLNNPNENIASWTKNTEDIFVLTYVYDGEAVVQTPFVSNAKNTINVYGRTSGGIEKTNTLTLEELAEVGSIVTIESAVTEKIYKGKMYLGQDTNYQTKSEIYISYGELVDGIAFAETTDSIAEGISTYLKTTKINKADAKKVLGEDGEIVIYNKENMTTPVKIINLKTEEQDGDYYTISYTEDISGITIIMGDVQEIEGNIIVHPLKSEGIIEIINEKTIKVLETENNKELISNLTELKTNTQIEVIDNRTNNDISDITIETITDKSTATLLEPKTTFDISLDKKSLSALTENNELRITAELISNNESNKLLNNPILKIELPSEVTELTVENISDVVGSDELSLKTDTADVVSTNETGNKVITVELEGQQTEYSSNNATIVIDAKVKINEFMADKNVEIKATCINDAENTEKAETVETKEIVKLVSKSGLVTKNTVTVGTNVSEEVNNNSLNATITETTNVKVNSAIINNFEENISNINIVGEIPTGMILTSAILSNTEGVVISYSEEENAAISSNNWTTEVTDYSKIKSFKLSLSEMTKASLIDLEYDLNINVETSTTLINNLDINYEINEQAKKETIAFNLNVEKETAEIPIVPEQPEAPVTPEEPQTPDIQSMITIVPKTTTNTLHEGQIVTYQIKVTNTTAQELRNVILDYAVPEGAVITNLTYAQGAEITFTDNEQTRNKTWTIENIKPNETIIKEVTIKIKDGTTQLVNTAILKDSQNNVINTFQSEPVAVNKGNLTVRLSRRDNNEMSLTSGKTIQYVVIVTNNTESQMNNLKITSQVTNQTTWDINSEYNKNWQYDSTSKNIGTTIDTLAPGETKNVRFEVGVNDINNTSCEATIENTAVVTTQTGENYETNIYANKILVPKLDIHLTSEHNEQLKEGEKVKYIIKVTNTGKTVSAVSVQDALPEEIGFIEVVYYTNEQNKFRMNTDSNDFDLICPVEIGETLTIEIQGIVYELEDSISSKQISNVAKIVLGEEKYLESETIVNTIVNDIVSETPEDPENPEEPQDPENPGNSENPEEPQDPENPEEPEVPEAPQDNQKYSISGLAWLDENKNGIRENQEKLLELLEVILLDSEGNQVDITTTSLLGTYKFSDLDKGEYTVVFSYDTEEYAVAKYQVEKAETTNNSDAISKEIILDDESKTVGITDIIKLNNENITNIDIGLVENPEFDLSLNKYISKVVVTNKEGTKTYEYDDTELAKVDIGAKYIEGTVLLVEYEIKISNDGDVNGYVTDIIDYLPEELEFNSEMNTEWYLGTDDYLHYMALDPQAIEPGKTQSIKLALTKTLKANSTGTIENTAEIYESANLEAIEELDSIAGNEEEGEDDIAKASLIISIRTGSPIMYIGIVIISMIILGIGIYIINKKILRVKI